MCKKWTAIQLRSILLAHSFHGLVVRPQAGIASIVNFTRWYEEWRFP